MDVGDRVRVRKPVIVYTHPEHRNQAFDIQGFEGEVEHKITDWKGRPVSANFPYRVKFNGRFKAHLAEEELEAL
ncbi:ferredoxin-thioredoxin reductase variable chain [Anthocerotibacter panamensis]|uniref:ferredoxin-thioredoxin reductase variable chain n=1 Tax=Anthocerotibacter panamensis TaxID=2857077 RepID=UPI001C401DE0|nr:ferredoxin-thioredoxin reductase variable chain [Anthocerotibacter panamensis]